MNCVPFNPSGRFLITLVVRKGLHVNIGLRLETNSSDLFLIHTFITQVRMFSCVSEDNYACEILP